MRKVFGYKHWTLEDVPRCFYVGKGCSSRPFSQKRNHKWHAIVKRYGLRVEICVGPMTNEEACAWETQNILSENTFTSNHSHDDQNDIGCNFTTGGEGVPGIVRSEAFKLLHRSPWSEVRRQAYETKQRGVPRKRLSSEDRHKMSMRRMGTSMPQEIRDKIARTQTGKKRGPYKRRGPQ